MAVKGKRCQDIKSAEWISLSFSDSFGPSQDDICVDDEDLKKPAEKKAKLHNSSEVDECCGNSVPKTNRAGRDDSKSLNAVWTDVYKPTTVNDLVVHRRKISEVDEYLQSVFSCDKYSKILLLTGPTGCGKSCTLSVLCKHLNINITEWVTPVDSYVDYSELSDSFNSFLKTPSTVRSTHSKLTIKLFDEFISQASKYSSLLSSNCKKLVLIKDFPNIFIEEPELFHAILKKYNNFINDSRLILNILSPLVFVISDTNIVRNLFPDELKQELKITNINFNPVTDTNTVKALNRILEFNSVNRSSSFLVPLKDDLLVIAESSDGDLRSAILKLQFNIIKTATNSVSKFKTPRYVPKLDSERIKVIKTTVKSKILKNEKFKVCVLDKDKTVDFFSSVGRVLYPKKISSDTNKEITKDDYKFVHSPSAIVDNFITEPNKFLNMLHENYLERFMNIKDVSDVAARLSCSDILLSSFWEGKETMVDYCLNVAVRAIMVSNTKPAANSFKPMSKSKIWTTETTKKDNLNLVRKIFLDRQSEKDVLLDVIPYVNKLKSNLNLNDDQNKIITKISLYK